jgi:hypothetical protein
MNTVALSNCLYTPIYDGLLMPASPGIKNLPFNVIVLIEPLATSNKNNYWLPLLLQNTTRNSSLMPIVEHSPVVSTSFDTSTALVKSNIFNEFFSKAIAPLLSWRGTTA